MDRETLEQYLAQAEKRIDESLAVVEKQTRLLEAIRAREQDDTIAAELLARFQATLENFKADRNLLMRFLHRSN